MSNKIRRSSELAATPPIPPADNMSNGEPKEAAEATERAKNGTGPLTTANVRLQPLEIDRVTLPPLEGAESADETARKVQRTMLPRLAL